MHAYANASGLFKTLFALKMFDSLAANTLKCEREKVKQHAFGSPEQQEMFFQSEIVDSVSPPFDIALYRRNEPLFVDAFHLVHAELKDLADACTRVIIERALRQIVE